MFAVVRTGGKQYLVSKNDRIEVESLEGKEGDKVALDVIGFAGGADLGGKVDATIVSHIRTDKVVVFKKKRRHNYRRTAGHRQHKTVIEITNIAAAK